MKRTFVVALSAVLLTSTQAKSHHAIYKLADIDEENSSKTLQLDQAALGNFGDPNELNSQVEAVRKHHESYLEHERDHSRRPGGGPGNGGVGPTSKINTDNTFYKNKDEILADYARKNNNNKASLNTTRQIRKIKRKNISSDYLLQLAIFVTILLGAGVFIYFFFKNREATADDGLPQSVTLKKREEVKIKQSNDFF